MPKKDKGKPAAHDKTGGKKEMEVASASGKAAGFLAPAPPDSVRVSLRVKPGAKRTQVVLALAHAGDEEQEEQAKAVLTELHQLELQIAAPPRDGEANTEVIDFVAELTGTKKGACSLVAGHASRDKVVEVRGVSVGGALESILRHVLVNNA